MTGLISSTFKSLGKKKAIIPFLTANYPDRATFLQLLHQLPKRGATMIEIGIPFSDPMADGPVIQKTSEKAISNGFSLDQCLSDVSEFKTVFPTIPIVLMTYANPIVQFGQRSFLSLAQKASIDGLLMVDVPPEHQGTIFSSTPSFDLIRLVTPTTNPSRLSIILNKASGFIYYVSVKGVTGSEAPDPIVVSQHISLLQSQCKLPMVIGFGISNVDLAMEMAKISDGIVVGSAFLSPFLNALHSDYTAIVSRQLSLIELIHHKINDV